MFTEALRLQTCTNVDQPDQTPVHLFRQRQEATGEHDETDGQIGRGITLDLTQLTLTSLTRQHNQVY